MSNPCIEIKTELGEIGVELFAKQAHSTVSNFLRYVNKQLFDNSSFFRIVNESNAEQPEDDNAPIQVIQGGLPPESKLLLNPIEHESTQETGILHLDGTISMARFDPGTADGSFFFCIGDQPELNFGGKRYNDGLGFAAFGRITSGKDILQKIYERAENREYLKDEVQILSIRKLES